MYRLSGFKRDMHREYVDTGEIVGKGARGVVSVVSSRSSGEKLACKTMLKNGKPVWKEVAALQAMAGNPLVAQLRDVYEDDSYVHLVMELCRGRTLEDAAGRMQDAEVREHVRSALSVVQSVHDAGMVHRDVKPANFVRVSPGGLSVKAVDFGLADALPVEDGTPVGTLWYMAPETFRSAACQKSDVWSAGVMAAELLCGQVPFDDFSNRRAPSVAAVIKSIMQDDLKLGAGSEEARDLVRRLLTKDVRARPTAAQALQHAWLA